MARLFVKSDKEGQILAVARVETLPEGRENPFYDDEDPTHEILEIKGAQLKSTFQDMQVLDIHMGYVVDTKKKVLKKKA